MTERTEFISANQGAWLLTGCRYKEQRQKMNLSVREVAKHIGVSETTLRSFEIGKPITRAKMIEHAYKNLLIIYNNNLQGELYEIH